MQIIDRSNFLYSHVAF